MKCSCPFCATNFTEDYILMCKSLAYEKLVCLFQDGADARLDNTCERCQGHSSSFLQIVKGQIYPVFCTNMWTSHKRTTSNKQTTFNVQQQALFRVNINHSNSNQEVGSLRKHKRPLLLKSQINKEKGYTKPFIDGKHF